jgi:hypothetical protein
MAAAVVRLEAKAGQAVERSLVPCPSRAAWGAVNDGTPPSGSAAFASGLSGVVDAATFTPI